VRLRMLRDAEGAVRLNHRTAVQYFLFGIGGRGMCIERL
jgi:hypothetical protein